MGFPSFAARAFAASSDFSHRIPWLYPFHASSACAAVAASRMPNAAIHFMGHLHPLWTCPGLEGSHQTVGLKKTRFSHRITCHAHLRVRVREVQASLRGSRPLRQAEGGVQEVRREESRQAVHRIRAQPGRIARPRHERTPLQLRRRRLRHLQCESLRPHLAETVRWFDWSEEAFRKARSEDKPIVMDLTAPWSHGCRVMDAQVYADPEIAALLNRDYVPLRVDCDRRPDINDRFNLGGWPTTAFLTPNGELLGGATFVPRDQMKQLLVQLKVGYAANRHRIAEEISRRDQKIREALEPQYSGVAQLTMEI